MGGIIQSIDTAVKGYGLYVLEYRYSRPVLGEPVLAGGIALDEGDGAESCPFESKVETTDSCEE